MKKSEIKAKIEKLKAKKDRLYRGDTPELKKLRTKRYELNQKIGKIERAEWEKNKSAFNKLDDEIEELRLEFAKPTSRSLQSVPSEELPKELREKMKSFCFRYEGGKTWRVIWVSPKKKCAIIHNPGRNFWSGIGHQSYGATQYELVDIKEYDGICDGILVKHEGRFSKKILAEFSKRAAEFEGTGK